MARLTDLLGLARRQIEVRPGSTFRRSGPGNWVETAKVCNVAVDPLGIPHVTYDLMIERNQLRLDMIPDRRTLNLRSFRDHFPEVVEA